MSSPLVLSPQPQMRPRLVGRPVRRRLNFSSPVPAPQPLVRQLAVPTGCYHELTRGPRRGQPCNKRFHRNSDYYLLPKGNGLLVGGFFNRDIVLDNSLQLTLKDHITQELHVHLDQAVPLAPLATPAPDIKTETARSISPDLRQRCLGI